MKYYIVMDPIFYANPHSVFANAESFNRENILKAFRKQSEATLFSDQDQAFRYAMNTKTDNISRHISPVIECELNENCLPNVEFCLPLKVKPITTFTYYKIPIKHIKNDNLLTVHFPKENIPIMNLKNYSKGCVII